MLWRVPLLCALGWSLCGLPVPGAAKPDKRTSQSVASRRREIGEVVEALSRADLIPSLGHGQTKLSLEQAWITRQSLPSHRHRRRDRRCRRTKRVSKRPVSIFP